MRRTKTDDRQLHFFWPTGPAAVDGPGPAYSVRHSKRAKHVSLEVSAQKGVVVVVPRWFDQSGIPAVLADNRTWIDRAWRRALADARAAKPEPPLRLPNHVCLPSLGQKLRVEYRRTASRNATARDHTDGRLIVSGPVRNTAACRAALRRWIARKAHRHLVPWLQELSRELDLPFARTVVRNQRTRWASCSWTKTISINQSLLFLPPELVRYVFIHELAHTIHLSHSRRYWALVRRHQPDYKHLEKELSAAGDCVPRWSRPE